MCFRHTADGAKYTIPVKNCETVIMRDILNEVIELRKLRVKIGNDCKFFFISQYNVIKYINFSL